MSTINFSSNSVCFLLSILFWCSPLPLSLSPAPNFEIHTVWNGARVCSETGGSLVKMGHLPALSGLPAILLIVSPERSPLSMRAHTHALTHTHTQVYRLCLNIRCSRALRPFLLSLHLYMQSWLSLCSFPIYHQRPLRNLAGNYEKHSNGSEKVEIPYI